MIDYEPIGDLIRSILDAAWNALAEIHKKRRAILLGELLDIAKHKRTPKVEPERREPQSLKNHPPNPSRR
jgi:hypothetical protein